MAQYHLFLLCLILADAYVSVTMAADEKTKTTVKSSSASISNTQAQASLIRKLGMHNPSVSKSSINKAQAISPSIAPASSTSQAPETEESVSILEQKIHLKNHHRSVDRSVAGGGVILGGLATTFLVAVFCYIKATARHKADTTNSPIAR